MPEIFNSAQLQNQPTIPSASNAEPEQEFHPVVSEDGEPLVATSETDLLGETAVAEQRKELTAPRNVNEYSQVMRDSKPTGNPFQAFAAKPINTFFDSQQESEQVLLLLRQHPITQLKWIIVGIVLVFLPFFFSRIGFFSFLPAQYQFIGLIGWYMMVTGYTLEAFLNWFYNVYIVTDERIIDVDFNSLLHKNVASAKLDKIEDVTATTAGALGAIFDYGNVMIQTAGSITEFDFLSVPHPSRVTAFLNEMLLEEELERIEGRVN